MSTPHPEGLGARLALRRRARARRPGRRRHRLHQPARHRQPEERRGRSARWSRALSRDTLHASSTKGLTGHTLGAAGIVEAVISLLAIEHGLLPGTLNTATLDAGLRPADPLRNARAARSRHAMNNSFGFGGNNCSLVFGKGAAA